ncbi:MAG: 5-dehydro-2-deoxygluconokinase, partial [Rhodobacteraceae bacterium]|nr:5-dehydro-2-deoxygluconokinase [Paracoccaceae bacterium]
MELLVVTRQLDVITIGRASVDIYGRQVGGLLEDMASFNKYIGGSPTNIAAGAARLGLRTALITRVGDEHFGRFIKNQLSCEGVDVSQVVTDRERLTALAILGIRDDETFPLIFYRENCADMALSVDDIDKDFVSSARCLCATGTHLSNRQTEAAVLKAVTLAREAGARTALDIDYRPNLWGLGGHDQGESRFIASHRVTDRMQAHLGLFDLIVGTEEEFHIAGGSTRLMHALANVRELTSATLVCKRGPLGAVAFAGPIPKTAEEGEFGEAFQIEVFNVLGAGDGFMAGLLKGWLDDSDWQTTMRIANACGALAVSRHGCAPSYPSLQELEFFLSRGVLTPALRHDSELEQVHWATNRNTDWPVLRILNIAGSRPSESKGGNSCTRGGSPSNSPLSCLSTLLKVAGKEKGYGVICDDESGRSALHRAAGTGLWIGRPVEESNSRPLRFEGRLGSDLGGLQEWPLEHVVRVRCICAISDSAELWSRQLDSLQRLFSAARRCRLELLIELIAANQG